MKKKVFWLAAMAVTVSMASCSLEEVVEQPTPQAIGFSSFVGKPTKAVTEIIEPDGTAGSGQTPLTNFWVFGGYGTKNADTYSTVVFENEQVTVTDRDFTDVGPTTTTKYWVADKDYMFVAYSNGNTQLTTTDVVSFDNSGHITITGYVAGDNDLILAAPNKYTTPATITTQPSSVQLEFKHLLSQVAFEFKNGFTNDYKVAITNLQFSVPNTATYSYKDGNYSWGTASGSATESFSINENNSFASTEYQTSSYEFVIPQNNSSITASFTVTVYESDGNKVVATKDYTADKAVSLATGTTTDPTGGNDNVWTSGYKYKYTAIINADILDDVLFPIQFEVTSVEGWKDSAAEDNFGLGL